MTQIGVTINQDICTNEWTEEEEIAVGENVLGCEFWSVYKPTQAYKKKWEVWRTDPKRSKYLEGLEKAIMFGL